MGLVRISRKNKMKILLTKNQPASANKPFAQWYCFTTKSRINLLFFYHNFIKFSKPSDVQVTKVLRPIEFLRLLVLVQNCHRHTIWVNVNKPSKQAKWHESLPCEGLTLGKMHARKETLLAGYLIPLLQSWKPCNKETQFPTEWGQRN